MRKTQITSLSTWESIALSDRRLGQAMAQLCIGVLFCSVAMSGQVPSPGTCLVVLQVMDYYGVPQSYKLLSIKDTNGFDRRENFTGLIGYLPCRYETYRFEVSRTDIDHVLGKIQGTVTVEYPENRKTVIVNPNVRLFGKGAGELSMALPSNYVWRGQLIGKKKDDQLWIHIRSVVGPTHEEAFVDKNGDFRVYSGFIAGRYLFYVMNAKGEVVYQTVLEITRFGANTPLSIDLRQGRPSTVRVE
jgi:hypothetical protein